ncbi:copper-binding protein [Terrarubrum flagellatum]|uniref:copper-binding protein n=1 Tax=Terrirubrum flagellatum TaxID=2895980 RepID=UPI003144D6E6
MFRRLIFISAAAALATSALAETAKVTGAVTKVDASAEKITIKHGPIANLDMGAMTMVFKAGDKAMLTAVKAGDQVEFEADRVNGQLTVTRIQKK